eukprot:5530179-Karenia_brevis.AAC.1
MHESMCQLLELMVCYDQLDAGALACAEVAARQIQYAEEKWKERILGQQGDMAAQDASLFSGAVTRGNLCICPDVSERISDELKGKIPS